MLSRPVVTFVLIGCLTILEATPAMADEVGGRGSIEGVLQGHAWRSIGPAIGGRSIAVAGHDRRAREYYFGATGGGLWKTSDGGTTWRPVTDGQIGSSSVGSVATAPGEPDIVYLGMGEGQLRSSVLQGDGIYQSDDAGKTWRHIGLRQTRVISAIRVHPTDSDLIYVAALGDPYVPSQERGIFRSNDGGVTWEKILFRSTRAGAIDVALDPDRPDVLYATLWQVERKPWRLWSGGDGSAVYKSMDGGDSWTEITANPGLPDGPLGKMAVSVSPADSDRVWLNVEATEGGLYRSDDAGKTWVYINGNRDLWQRSFYFMRVRAHPKDRDTVFVLNYALQKSTDGGETFSPLPTRHADVHDLWIDSGNPDRMIVADDGGASVSVNGGQTWTEQDVPTAQMYRVSTTDDFPYHVCGSQQDALSVCVTSRTMSARFGTDVYSVYYAGGGENTHVAPHPTSTGRFFAGATNSLNQYDRETGLSQDVHPHPYLVMGQAASTMTERWNWIYPIVFSPIPPHTLYVGSQHVWQSEDDGRHWKRLSPDLTRADPATLGDSGGPIVLDQDGPEIYGTIHTIAPSRHDGKVIWTGSDDGLIHVTEDAGRTWRNVTPSDMLAYTRVSLIDASPHSPATAYVAGNRYDLGDRRPYLWKLEEFGRRWSKIDAGLPVGGFVHAVREDPVVAGVLYVGTEHGVHVSLDDGNSWQSMQQNLPVTRVPDLQVAGNDLVIATHGRSFYIMEGLATLRQLARDDELSNVRLFEPGTAYRRLMPVHIDFYLPQEVQSASLEILDAGHRHVRMVFESRPFRAGSHRVAWDLRHDGAVVFDGMILEAPSPEQGPWAVPGLYKARLILDGEEYIADFHVEKDPRLEEVSDADLEKQLALALAIRDATSRANEAVMALSDAAARIRSRMEGGPQDTKGANDLLERLHAVESRLYQTRNRSPKDKIAYPIRLNDRLAGLLSKVESGDAAPTSAHHEIFALLNMELGELLGETENLLQRDVPALLAQSTSERQGGR